MDNYKISYLNKFDFQALPFYRELGCQIFGVLEEVLAGHFGYFLQMSGLGLEDGR